MSLKNYRKKRDFSRTDEPTGKKGPVTGNLFVIQKHAASRLHYDLRLELNGVLKSWAVPKGPSLDPGQKRLAVQVEDHPVEYGSFEGTIPQGEYGGGTVMVWDRGTWEPEGNPEQELEKGKLAFRLHGEKLRGSWALARMRERDGKPGKNWLLIKHKDGEAVAEKESSIVVERPLSVISHRTMDEIDATKDAFAREADPAGLTDAVRGKQPKVMKPQLAVQVDEPPTGGAWLHEIKLDGYRIVTVIKGGKIVLLSRNGKDWTARFPAISEAIQALPVKEAVLDGEIVVQRPDGTSDFQALQNFLNGSRAGRPIYYLFDLPYCNGYDLTRSPLLERKNLLQNLIARMAPPQKVIRFSDHIRGEGEEIYRQACLLATEGIISKQVAAPYEQKRSRSWLKIKCLHQQEFVIGGWTEPQGSRTGFGALLLGYYVQNDLIYAGRVGTGFSEETLRRLAEMFLKKERKTPPFRNPPTSADARGVHWLKPKLVCEVKFLGWTEDDILRQASFLGLREDKSPREVVREAAVPATGRGKSTAIKTGRREQGMKRSALSEVIGGIRITNPDKVLYPEQGITKRALAEYYLSVADYILPYLVHRPLTFLRCPEGRGKGCFYQKHLRESIPDALRAVPIREKSAKADYIVVDDIKGLLSLVQLGVLEIHPWGSSEADLEKPDMITFDLDPGSGLDWPEVIEGARFLRGRLEEIGLVSFVKTSGGKGLHLAVPIRTRLGWRDAKDFTRKVALQAVRLRPDLFTAEIKKEKRRSRIFIDYLRNARGATTVAVYSTRAVQGAPVSTPIRWDELNRSMRPDRYRIDNLPKRLAVLKNDPWEDFFKIRQNITDAMLNAVSSQNSRLRPG